MIYYLFGIIIAMWVTLVMLALKGETRDGVLLSAFECSLVIIVLAILMIEG